MIKATRTISNTWETKILKHKVIKSDKCPFFAVSLYKDWVQYTSFHLYNIIIYSLILNELIIQKKKMFKKQTCRIFWCNSKINCCSPPFFIYFTKGHSQVWIRGLTSVMGSCMAYSLNIKKKEKKNGTNSSTIFVGLMVLIMLLNCTDGYVKFLCYSIVTVDRLFPFCGQRQILTIRLPGKALKSC